MARDWVSAHASPQRLGVRRLRRATLRSTYSKDEAELQRALERVRRALLPDEMEVALDRLSQWPGNAGIRPVLVERYLALTGGRRRDADGRLRWLLLRALQGLATAADVPLLLDATRRFEYLPQSLEEVAHGIRAEGLHRLLELDRDLALWRAIELLADGHDNLVTGEPARTAVRVLGSTGELALLYGIALDNPYGLPPAARAESLLWLDGLPEDRLRTVVDRFLARDEPNLLLAVIELGIERRGGWLEDMLIDGLLATSHVDAFRYAILEAIARHRLDLVERLSRRLNSKGQAQKLAMLHELRLAT